MTPGWVIVSGDFTPLGGMDLANMELAKYLATQYPTHVVTHRADESLAGMSNVIIHKVPRPYGRHFLGSPLLARAGRAVASQLASEGFRVVVNGGNCHWPDVSWLHCVHASYRAPVVGGLVRRLKIWGTHAIDRWNERVALIQARFVVCNSRRTARDAVERIGVNPERVRVVYLGTEPSRFQPMSAAGRAAMRLALDWDDRPWVAFVGQLGNRIKGFDTLYAAWVELCHDPTWDVNLAVFGSGATLTTWASHAASDGLASRIRFLGFRKDIIEILGACDAVVQPSRYDAYGLAAHEALCRGLPVLVSIAAGVAERYPYELADLLISDPDDVAGLVERLRHWRMTIDVWPARVAPFSAVLRGYTWFDMAADFVKAVSK